MAQRMAQSQRHFRSSHRDSPSSVSEGRDSIVVHGARVNNLKNIDVTIPRNRLVVITGLSGSGKSSLAFDTIYAEGQRRYVESLSAYARQFLGVMDKPDVDRIDGLSPAIAIDQKSVSKNPRSTVGTITEVYDYLRLLFARVGAPHCPACGRPVARQSVRQIIDHLIQLPSGRKLNILAPKVRDRKGEHRTIFEGIRQAGFVRVRVDGVVMDLEEAMAMTFERQKKHSIEVVVDRLFLDPADLDIPRMSDSIETAIKISSGFIIIEEIDEATQRHTDHHFSDRFACDACGVNLPELEPRLFSFNSPHGACSACTGLGTKLEVDSSLVVPNPSLTIAEGAIRPWSKTISRQSWTMRTLEAVATRFGFSLDTPFSKLSKDERRLVLYGTGTDTVHVSGNGGKLGSRYEVDIEFEGVIPQLERRYRETDSEYVRADIEQYMRHMDCPVCEGKRLNKEALAVTVAGLSIHNVVTENVSDIMPFFEKLRKNEGGVLSTSEAEIARSIIREILSRLQFLCDVGLEYLTLDRSASTLSGGEAQRIRLATQIGSRLVGVLYVLDEPSIGLHQRDNARLIKTLKKLRDLGNTVLVVEHDEEMMRAADTLIDIGPGAGDNGGRVIANGTPAEIMRMKTLTGDYLSGRKSIPVPKKVRGGNGKAIVVEGACEHNLQNIDVRIPLGRFVCVTGVSGSGKSTLINDILAKSLAKFYHHAKEGPGAHKRISGLEYLNKVITIDQSPIGRTPRSNPSTYTGVFTPIRELFASTPEAKARGYKAGRFSFNVQGGRCETCQGDGVRKIEMHFLPDVYVECEECRGKRYNPEALEIEYKGVTIADVLNMTVEYAMTFFKNVPAIETKLRTLSDVGLSYIKLGQSATTLSGGEAQRIKLATELSRRATGRTLYILDEPTTGLHFDDIRRLLYVLHRLVDKGNSLLVIEHQLDVIKCADHIIDMGPEGGDAGGKIVCEGEPLVVAKCKRSYTGQYLRTMLK